MRLWQRWGKASFRFGNGVWYFEGEWKEDAPCPEGLLRGPHLSYVGEVMAVITSARGAQTIHSHVEHARTRTLTRTQKVNANACTYTDSPFLCA